MATRKKSSSLEAFLESLPQKRIEDIHPGFREPVPLFGQLYGPTPESDYAPIGPVYQAGPELDGFMAQLEASRSAERFNLVVTFDVGNGVQERWRPYRFCEDFAEGEPLGMSGIDANGNKVPL